MDVKTGFWEVWEDAVPIQGDGCFHALRTFPGVPFPCLSVLKPK